MQTDRINRKQRSVHPPAKAPSHIAKASELTPAIPSPTNGVSKPSIATSVAKGLTNPRGETIPDGNVRISKYDRCKVVNTNSSFPTEKGNDNDDADNDKFNPEKKYLEENISSNDKKPPINKSMNLDEIEQFKKVLAKSYNRSESDIIWVNEIDNDTKKPTGSVTYYVRVIDRNTNKIMKDEETGSDMLRRIFTLNVK